MDNNEQFDSKTNEEERKELAKRDRELLISQLRNGRTQGHDQR